MVSGRSICGDHLQYRHRSPVDNDRMALNRSGRQSGTCVPNQSGAGGHAPESAIRLPRNRAHDTGPPADARNLSHTIQSHLSESHRYQCVDGV